jgi:hypothetical protein
VLDGIRVVRTRCFKNFLEMVLVQLSVSCLKSRLADATNSLSEPLTFSLMLSLFVTTVRRRGRHFWPFSTLSTLLGAYGSDAGGAIWSPSAVTIASTRARATLMASPEACQVVISSNSFMVSGCLQPNSCTRVRHVVSSQKAEMTSVSATLGSASHF